MAERKNVDRTLSFSEQAKIARKRKGEAKERGKIERENLRLMLLGLGVKRKQDANKALKRSARYRATYDEVVALAAKAELLLRRQYAELAATLATDEQKRLLESLTLSSDALHFLLQFTIDLQKNPLLMDSPKSKYKESLIEISLYLSQHGEEPG